MARVEALEWKSFMRGEVKPIEPQNKKLLAAGLAAVSVVTLLTYVEPTIAAGKAVAVIAAPDFATSLHQAAQPIHDLIRGFAHEIYAIFMGWGAIEAMIGKPQQGFIRMKTATLGYVLLYWVPTMIDLVNKARPGV